MQTTKFVLSITIFATLATTASNFCSEKPVKSHLTAAEKERLRRELKTSDDTFQKYLRWRTAIELQKTMNELREIALEKLYKQTPSSERDARIRILENEKNKIRESLPNK